MFQFSSWFVFNQIILNSQQPIIPDTIQPNEKEKLNKLLKQTNRSVDSVKAKFPIVLHSFRNCVVVSTIGISQAQLVSHCNATMAKKLSKNNIQILEKWHEAKIRTTAHVGLICLHWNLVQHFRFTIKLNEIIFKKI